MLESAFRDAVLGKLPKTIHRQPMMAGMMGYAGTPDTYVDGPRMDLWVEWKMLPDRHSLPAVVPEKSMPTPLQQRWLTRRFNTGGNAVCIVGVKRGGRAHGFVMDSPSMWSPLSPLPRDLYEPLLVPAAALAIYIEGRVT